MRSALRFERPVFIGQRPFGDSRFEAAGPGGEYAGGLGGEFGRTPMQENRSSVNRVKGLLIGPSDEGQVIQAMLS